MSHGLYRFQYPVSCPDLSEFAASDSLCAVHFKGEATVFDAFEIRILRALLRGEDDLAIAQHLQLPSYAIPNLWTRLRREFGIATRRQLAQLGSGIHILGR